MIWLVVSFIGAIATSLTTIFAKIGLKNVNSNFATFYRTGIIIVFSLIICLVTHSFSSINTLTYKNWLFLILSGALTGCSWLCYFKAIKLGNINKVAPIDKSSFVLTSILFFIFFFDETTKGGNLVTISMLILAILLMISGTFLMINKTNNQKTKSQKWLIYAIFSSVFASLVSLFVKIGLQGIPTQLGTLIRTIIVFIFAGSIVMIKKDYSGVKKITKKNWLFLSLSGISTGIVWLSEYYALNMEGVNPIAVNSISKLAILLTMAFSFFILKEKFNKKSLCGLALLTSGIILIIIFSL